MRTGWWGEQMEINLPDAVIVRMDEATGRFHKDNVFFSMRNAYLSQRLRPLGASERFFQLVSVGGTYRTEHLDWLDVTELVRAWRTARGERP